MLLLALAGVPFAAVALLLAAFTLSAGGAAADFAAVAEGVLTGLAGAALGLEPKSENPVLDFLAGAALVAFGTVELALAVAAGGAEAFGGGAVRSRKSNRRRRHPAIVSNVMV